jgi:hypothetical protein
VIDLQGDIIDDGKRTETLGQATQFNRRHSHPPRSLLSCGARPSSRS